MRPGPCRAASNSQCSSSCMERLPLGLLCPRRALALWRKTAPTACAVNGHTCADSPETPEKHRLVSGRPPHTQPKEPLKGAKWRSPQDLNCSEIEKGTFRGRQSLPGPADLRVLCLGTRFIPGTTRGLPGPRGKMCAGHRARGLGSRDPAPGVKVLRSLQG